VASAPAYHVGVDPERTWSLEPLLAETRADVRHLHAGLGELRHDVRRLDGRVFQLLLVQLATLAAALGSLAGALAAAFG
jgi:hypothetical protein